MTFFDISKKMLRFGFDRYRLYFLCNVSAAALFCCFALIFSNPAFMNGQIVNSSISGNIFLPAVVSAVFLIFFLPVSCQAFLSSRKQEYGVMFSLGMSRKEGVFHLFFEHTVVSLSALAAALAAGTVLSFLFFAVILYGIGITGVQWQFCSEAYKITFILYAAVTAAAFVWNGGKFMRDKIGILLKAKYRSEKTGKFFKLLNRLMPGYMNRHFVAWSFVRRHKKVWIFKYTFAAVIVAAAALLMGSCITMYPGFLRDAENYSPYDMVYAQIDGMNQVPIQEAVRILEQNGTKADQVIRLPYVRDGSFNYISAADVNKSIGCNYQIQEGEFLNLFQYDPKDGYEHNMQPVSAVTISGNQKLRSAGSDVRILFNQNAAFADRTLIVNATDFDTLRADTTRSAGCMNLFVFAQWENSYQGICAVKEYLQNSNHTDDEEQHYYALSSKVERYRDAEKSGQFLIFLMVFVTGLMLSAEFLLIHSQIQAEREETDRAVKSLKLFGMAEREIGKCLRYRNFLRFLPPLIAGTILSLLPSYYLNESYGMGKLGVLAGAVFGIVLIFINAVLLCRAGSTSSG